ncbi:putative glutamine amidotransferase [Thermocatellispora tengchongensis]|uniref:Putative glutamine amidotransferase n=1 Tax=Thermocatellispora tengchongensis TaxID=1073253 RepID=A0A840P2P1_9ACTN|nr:gamma-glutamyl-gamma-aminobutyrate hydrolase family protein [Thermocatellispora tengchongensis]MBB5132193.1 putative glutamine amidotransferase [Thermocatellispora tengchongensis]
MSGPLIGITGRRQMGVPGTPPSLYGIVAFTYFADYCGAVAAMGGVPILLSFNTPPEAVADRLDGVVLSGGEDVDPRRYGGTPSPFQTPLDPDRDEYELTLLRAALDRRLPLLAICRGAQLLNVALGGTLVPHLPPDSGEGHSYLGYPRGRRSHAVRIAEDSRTAGVLGTDLVVNSYHHQAVDRVGAGLRAVGHAPDGVVEAIEMDDAPVIGVQWHPEMFAEPDPLFGWLVDEAKNHQGETV